MKRLKQRSQYRIIKAINYQNLGVIFTSPNAPFHIKFSNDHHAPCTNLLSVFDKKSSDVFRVKKRLFEKSDFG